MLFKESHKAFCCDSRAVIEMKEPSLLPIEINGRYNPITAVPAKLLTLSVLVKHLTTCALWEFSALS